jgi:diguanylate cyclase (GGDEF)-like protein
MLALPDLETLRLCSLLNTFAFGGLFLFLWLGRRDERHLLYWSASGILYGAVLVGFYASSGHIWATAALMGLLAFSNVLPVMGLRRFQGRPVVERWMAWPVVVIVAGYLVPRLLAGVPPLGPLAISGGETLGLAGAMAISGTVMIQGGARGHRLAGGAMLAYLPAFALGYLAQWRGMPGSMMGLLPLMADQVLLGIINVGLLAIPYDRAQQKLRDAVQRDPLTGALNRVGLGAHLPRLMHAGATLIAIDIDHFKQINDAYGHQAGDDLLVALAEEGAALAQAQGGVLARLGGDEFVMLLPAYCVDPVGIGQMLRLRLRSRYQRAGSTLSMGLATMMSNDDFTSGLHRADLALYRAKAGGRDRLAA